MRTSSQLGKVAEWHDDRGYGFIVPLDAGTGPERLFFHIRDYSQDGRRPETGELVRFSPQRQDDGRWRAAPVVRAASAARRSTAHALAGRARSAPSASGNATRSGGMAMSLLLAAWCALIGGAIHAGRLPIEVLPALLVLNLLTFAAYALDKRAAQAGRWRTPEAHLHLLELLGGWPAAWLAQRRLRHKSAKRGYRMVFWTMAVLHVLAVALWLAA
ncbi:DUF1294 domain-containing protein [Luteimonas sp. BDR2-5]|uniref:DUF1294 domain-containing protein n=1 Tax=Proluteimonas luteida TaxID=2878685 RepID=UPI001E59507C|nr:DUF1294 domain-containing protein [Luteimonas sp. BDR2-5]MCD9029282.1 DUF1294 domain-containing protein [Luteimonas sp. BDR2-5]